MSEGKGEPDAAKGAGPLAASRGSDGKGQSGDRRGGRGLALATWVWSLDGFDGKWEADAATGGEGSAAATRAGSCACPIFSGRMREAEMGTKVALRIVAGQSRLFLGGGRSSSGPPAFVVTIRLTPAGMNLIRRPVVKTQTKKKTPSTHVRLFFIFA